MQYVFDTSAWLSYLNGEVAGAEVRRLLQRAKVVYTPASVAAEVVEAAKLRQANSKTFMAFLLSRSQFAPLIPEIARIAGKINAERGHEDPAWTMLESIVLATARHFHARLVTKDPIYRDSDNVQWLPATRAAAPRASA